MQEKDGKHAAENAAAKGETATLAPWRVALAEALAGNDPVLGAAVPRIIAVFILLTAGAVALETVRGLPEWIHVLLLAFEVVAVAVFLTEYVLRLFAAEKPLRYALSFWGIVDLLSFLPTILLLGFDLLGLRALRLLRLLRLLKLVKREAPVLRLWKSLAHVQDELVAVLVAALIMLYLSAAGIYFFEHRVQPEAFPSIPASMWWAIVTLTTVGYGDIVPVTTGGRVFTGFVMLVGIGLISVPTALIASAMMATRRAQRNSHALADRISGPIAQRVSFLVEQELERQRQEDEEAEAAAAARRRDP
ncbi:MAG: ion transporter [Pseudomonadota bacterium]